MLYYQSTILRLNNYGATCFMNATLQCLSQAKALTNFFLNKNNREIISLNNKNELSPVYFELINKLWQVNGPKSLKKHQLFQIYSLDLMR